VGGIARPGFPPQIGTVADRFFVDRRRALSP
jgi:hypothetical protein